MKELLAGYTPCYDCNIKVKKSSWFAHEQSIIHKRNVEKRQKLRGINVERKGFADVVEQTLIKKMVKVADKNAVVHRANALMSEALSKKLAKQVVVIVTPEVSGGYNLDMTIEQ